MNVTKHEVLAAVERQRARTLALCRSLTAEEWETTALPGWRVREVVGHLVASDEGALKLRMLKAGVRSQPDGGLAAIEQWNEAEVRRWSERPTEQIVAGLETWGRRSLRVFKTTPAPVLRLRVPLPFGRVPLLWLGQIRVFDEWVHEQDIRRALAKPGTDPDCVGAAARALLDVFPRQTPVRIGDDARGRVALRFDGLDIAAYTTDLAAKRFGVDGAADATVTADAASIIMVAAGRDAWRDAEGAGLLRVEGDRAAAEAFLDALRAA